MFSFFLCMFLVKFICLALQLFGRISNLVNECSLDINLITINVTISRIVEGCYKITGMILKDRGILEGNFILWNSPKTGLGKITSRVKRGMLFSQNQSRGCFTIYNFMRDSRGLSKLCLLCYNIMNTIWENVMLVILSSTGML